MKTLTIWSCFALLSFVGAQEVDFRLKFEAGKTYITESTVLQKMTMSLGGNELKTKATIQMTNEQAVEAAEAGVKVTQRIDRMIMDMDMPGGAMKFDSNNPEGPMGAALQPMLDAKSEVTYDAEGKITDINVPDIPGMENLGMDKETLIQSAKQMADMFPNKVVKVGETWESKTTLPMGQLTQEPLEMTYKMKFVGMDGKLAKVEMNGTLTMDDENLKITAKKLIGKMLYDPELGQAKEMEVSMALEMGLPAGIPVQEGAPGAIPIEMDMVTKLVEVK